MTQVEFQNYREYDEKKILTNKKRHEQVKSVYQEQNKKLPYSKISSKIHLAIIQITMRTKHIIPILFQLNEYIDELFWT